MSANRASSRASGTTRTSGCGGSNVHAQKLERRSVSVAKRPQMDLNHWRSVSTRETIAMGTLKMVQSCERVFFCSRFWEREKWKKIGSS